MYIFFKMDLPKNVAVVKYASVKDLQNVAKKLDNNIIALEKVSKKNTDDIENIEYWLIKFIIIGIYIKKIIMLTYTNIKIIIYSVIRCTN